MKLNYIHIDSFGKLKDLEFKLADGINIVYGRNEAGKSTIHAFIETMFFGMEERPAKLGKEDVYERYRNWDDGDERYGGEIGFSYDGVNYRLRRDLHRGRRDMTITLENGTRINDPERLLSQALMSLTQPAYRSTISIGQLSAATGREMAKELGRYIEDLNATGSPDLSADAALEYLDREKERIEKDLDDEAVKSYAKVIGRIKNLETELSAPENENLLGEYSRLRDDADEELKETESELARLREEKDSAKAVLSENGLSDRRSIDELEDELRDSYSDYLYRKDKAGKYWPFVTAVICFIATAAALGGWSYLYYNNMSYVFPPVPYPTLPIAAAVFAALAVILSFINVSRKRGYKAAKAALSDSLRERLGSKEISESAMDLLHERMEGFRRLYEDKVDVAEKENELSSRIADLGRKQSGYSDDMLRQQSINREVEIKLMLLNSLKNRSYELRKLIAENKRLRENIDAIGLAKENILELSEGLRGSVGTYLNEEAGKILCKVTKGAYRRIEYMGDGRIYINDKNRSISLDSLSMGAMDQVYLALRLSAVKLIEGGTEDGRLPVFFDDSFILYDDERLKAAMGFIAGYFKGQTILFTCQHRESEALLKLGRPFELIEL